MRTSRVQEGVAAGFAIRELSGRDEMLLSGRDTATAVRLLDAVIVERPEPWSGPADALPAPVRDALLAELHTLQVGPRVDGSPQCDACGEPFDLEFEFRELLDVLHEDLPTARDGAYETPRGRVRAPTAADELAVAAADPEQAASILVSRCVLQGDPSADLDGWLVDIEEISPVARLDIDTRCPGCSTPQKVPFDLQQYVLESLAQHTQNLMYETHRLASAYGWSLDEILSLSRVQRQHLVGLVEADLGASVLR